MEVKWKTVTCEILAQPDHHWICTSLQMINMMKLFTSDAATYDSLGSMSGLCCDLWSCSCYRFGLGKDHISAQSLVDTITA